MDIPRKPDFRKRRLRRIAFTLTGGVMLLAATLALSRLKPAAPEVDRSTVWIDMAKRGAMDIQVHGLGKLVPESILWIPAPVEGRVEQETILPGMAVKPETVLLKLTNPEIEQAALDAQWQLKAAESGYTSLQAKLASQVLDQRSAAATARSDYLQARLQAESDAQLARQGRRRQNISQQRFPANHNTKVSEEKYESCALQQRFLANHDQVSCQKPNGKVCNERHSGLGPTKAQSTP